MTTDTLITDRTPDELAPLVARVADRAPAVDCGDRDVRQSLAELGGAGLLGLGLPAELVPEDADGGTGTLADQAAVVRHLAGVCTATAFSVWAHRTAVDYIAKWGSRELRTQLLPDLLAGRRPGATAMATAFQAALGLKELTVVAREDEGGVTLDGTIPWASNLFEDGAVVILPARTEEGRNLVVAITTDQPGVELLPYPALLALDATASTTVRLSGVHVATASVLTDRFLDFLADVRPSFLLLQTALCLGLADAAIEASRPRHVGTGATFASEHDDLDAQGRELDTVYDRRLRAPHPADDELIRLRLQASQLAVAATRHEAAVTGGAGYLATSATARRLREAAFLPIQSPTEAQLRWELSRSA